MQVDLDCIMVNIFVEVEDLQIIIVSHRVEIAWEVDIQENAMISGLAQYDDNERIKGQGAFILDNFDFICDLVFFCKPQ